MRKFLIIVGVITFMLIAINNPQLKYATDKLNPKTDQMEISIMISSEADSQTVIEMINDVFHRFPPAVTQKFVMDGWTVEMFSDSYRRDNDEKLIMATNREELEDFLIEFYYQNFICEDARYQAILGENSTLDAKEYFCESYQLYLDGMENSIDTKLFHYFETIKEEKRNG